jgi:MinD-like ATPase involved in chromosome partitioning or flagellar assembly
LLLASENPSDLRLTSELEHFETLVTRLSGLSRYIILDLGAGLHPYIQKILPLCTSWIVVLEGMPNMISHTKMLINEMANLGIDRTAITVVLNNRVRSDAQMPWMEVQQSLGHSIGATLTPAPEMMIAASRVHTLGVFSQPTSLTSLQILKLADMILEREKAIK